MISHDIKKHELLPHYNEQSYLWDTKQSLKHNVAT